MYMVIEISRLQTLPKEVFILFFKSIESTHYKHILIDNTFINVKLTNHTKYSIKYVAISINIAHNRTYSK